MSTENEFFLYDKPKKNLKKYKIVGLLPDIQFQKCRYLVEKLHSTYPKEYDKPEIRAMLNLDWDIYLTKMKRRHGKPYYLIKSPVAVYYNGDLLGDDKNLVKIISEHYKINLTLDFEKIAETELIDHFKNITDKYQRKFVFVTIAVDERVIGSMLFMLYNDLVPKTCENFLSRCVDKDPLFSYKGTKIQRIAKYSWIQCGGYKLQNIQMPCENYAVPHDRRGVLSMCNKRRHEDNSTQFFITLEKVPWMDYNYVAFGQLIQGAEILNLLEKTSTYHQNPLRKIEIFNCGEFSLCPTLDEDYMHAVNPSYSSLFDQDIKADDVASILSATALKVGKYYLRTDLRSYMPFTRYSKMFEKYIGDDDMCEIQDNDVKKILKCVGVEQLEEEPDRQSCMFKPSGQFYSEGRAIQFD